MPPVAQNRSCLLRIVVSEQVVANNEDELKQTWGSILVDQTTDRDTLTWQL